MSGIQFSNSIRSYKHVAFVGGFAAVMLPGVLLNVLTQTCDMLLGLEGALKHYHY
jgi:hypothetical protein